MALSHQTMNNQTSSIHPKAVQVRMKADTHKWIHEQALAQERSANWIINRILEQKRAQHSSTPKGQQ